MSGRIWWGQSGTAAVTLAAALATFCGSVRAQETAAPPKARAVDGDDAPQALPEERDTVVRVQIFLDENNHGPGKIDGKLGEFGKKAASVYNQIRGLPPGDYTNLIADAERAVTEPYAIYTVAEGDLKFVTPGLPAKPEQQAKQKYMGYRSLLEMVAERFHTSEEFLQSLNGKNLYNLRAGSELQVPNVKPFRIEDLPKHRKFEKDEVLSRRAVVVDIAARVAVFFDENNKPFASFPITPGKPKFIQFGEWKVTNMVTTPEFRWDKSMLEKGQRSEQAHQIPIGPNSPVGIVWTGTSRSGIGLHGTATPHSIGRSESAGCIRFANWDAVRLPDLIRPGARVVIR
jgi:lipoprotein-anchoring transpeptidase ErfK/SrfK